MITLLDILNEAKIDDEYNRNWSMIDRETFDAIVKTDPKTTYSGDEVRSMGFVTKQLILPKYRDGEKDFMSDLNRLEKALEKFYSNIAKYPKVTSYRSVADFITYVENPDTAQVDLDDKEVDPITQIYDKYYTDISREDFDAIISLDEKTTKTSIGEIAKNLLLGAYRKKENILNNKQEVAKACKNYYEIKNTLPKEKQQLTSYKSVAEFVDYMSSGPESNLVTELKENEEIDEETGFAVKDSFKLIGSTLEYDIIEPLSHAASVAISGGRSTSNNMKWCTGDPDSDMYWRRYTNGRGRLFCFMHKTKNRGSQNRTFNWQVQIRNNSVLEFLDGNDDRTFPGDSAEESFKNFLTAHLDIFNAIKNKDPFDKLAVIKEVELASKYAKEPFVVDSIEKASLLIVSNLENVCNEVIFKINKIPSSICANFIALEKVTFEEGVVEIGAQAFINCVKLKDLKLPESLEIIGKQAFMNCLQLTGSIRIPDNVKEIRTRAFARNKCKLKINRARASKIKFDIIDKDWISSHVQLITVNQ
ncbi:MAG: leucine-rich repeat protein [Bacilli bacterium]|nr:leucine-rich repeat protein [Bacilli bacterium]